MTDTDREARLEEIRGRIDKGQYATWRKGADSWAATDDVRWLLSEIDRLRTDRALLRRVLYREDSSDDGAGLIPAVEWMLDIIKMYEGRLEDFGDPPEMIYSDVNEAAKEKARRDLRATRRALDRETP